VERPLSTGLLWKSITCARTFGLAAESFPRGGGFVQYTNGMLGLDLLFVERVGNRRRASSVTATRNGLTSTRPKRATGLASGVHVERDGSPPTRQITRLFE
jgi:hypothetical protein